MLSFKNNQTSPQIICICCIYSLLPSKCFLHHVFTILNNVNAWIDGQTYIIIKKHLNKVLNKFIRHFNKWSLHQYYGNNSSSKFCLTWKKSLNITVIMMNSFCGMVDQRKAFSLISSRNHCQRSLTIANLRHAACRIWTCVKPEYRFWCTVVITTTPRRHSKYI